MPAAQWTTNYSGSRTVNHSASRTTNHTIETWERKVPKEWSEAHKSVMKMLIRHHIPFYTEEPITCKPCDDPLCHHQFKVDIQLVNVGRIIEPHHPQGGDDEEKQLRKIQCLRNDGWLVTPMTDVVALENPESILHEIGYD